MEGVGADLPVALDQEGVVLFTLQWLDATSEVVDDEVVDGVNKRVGVSHLCAGQLGK